MDKRRGWTMIELLVVIVVMSGWIDYLQLVKWNGRWVILNVLWEVRDKT